MKVQRVATLFASATLLAILVAPWSPSAIASDWEEEAPKQPTAAPQPAVAAPELEQPRKKKKKVFLPGRIEANDTDLNSLKGRSGTSDDTLRGGANDNALQGGAQDEGGGDLTPMQPRSGKPILQGSAMQSDYGPAGDPDMDDQELQVAWDKWRNKFLWAVQSGVQEALNNPDDVDLRFDPRRGMVVVRFPLGTTAWFHCKISADRHIVSAKIKQSSGFPNFDQAVLNSINHLEGSSYLRFPSRSQRQFVTQTAGIKTSDSPERQYFKFGDVERYRVPGQ
ncbi:MAG: hypothetical protein C0507_12095 [Cyanobacteria bacterium PR.3.49]|nr:hypothetical protein [Cyanobacteria bacterium PR.3.49]